MAQTDTFRGYSTDLLVRVKNMGRSILGDDDLFDAAQAYTDPSKGGGNFGPALLTEDCTVSVTPALSRAPELDEPAAPTAVKPAEDGADPWAGYEIHDLKDLMKVNGLTPPRVLTVGRAIEQLEAAGVKP